MSNSNELQIGKAGEHFVCCDLILQGYNAFLADQGLLFDVVVEVEGTLYTIQVKATQGLVNFKQGYSVYRFNTRRAKGNRTRFNNGVIDFFAFVALDIMCIAYVPIDNAISRRGSIKQCFDFKSREIQYTGRTYSNGTTRTPEWGKYLQDYSEFKI